MENELSPKTPTWREFLQTHYAADFLLPRPEWDEIETAFASWRTYPYMNEGSRMLIAVRTSETGTINSFGLNLDDPEDIGHITFDRGATLDQVVDDFNMREEIGMIGPEEEDLLLMAELVGTLMMFDEIG